ncbi:Uncharacterised protein [Yersinia similis]|uniref:hypothetical protein n=1 Tax=Yersinia similis TaxID=367190 RepID=UPI0005DDB3AF|nr:hypothetical protein [Yersinia similis]CNF62744.1 Uncharacterised protein [Yersinia similis]
MRNNEKDGQTYSNCAICGKEVKYGQGAYDLRPLELYGVHCCDACWDGNWDGWGPRWEHKILAILKEKNLPTPERNEKGWLPRN